MSAGASALRIARRDALRAPLRSLLIAVMVALPVSGAGFLDIMLRTTSITGAEKIPLELGSAADVRIIPGYTGDAVVQRPDDTYGSAAARPVDTSQTPPVDPRPLLPPGSRVITDRTGEVQVRTADGLARTSLRELDYTDPLAQGLIIQTSGRAPRSPDEIVVSRTLLDTLGFRVGDMLQMTRPGRTFTVVGTVRPASDESRRSLAVGMPGAALAALDQLNDSAPADLLVDSAAPFTWEQVKALNARGVTAFARQPVENPPPRSAIPYYGTAGDQGSNAAELVLLGLIVGLVVLEVVLLAGAAFAVGTRRQSRALGLYAATGATGRQVRSVVLAQGLVLGVVGGLAGLALAFAGVAAGVPIIQARFDTELPALDLRPAELLALTMIGVVTGLLAAVLPARTAARQDVVMALSGRRGTVQSKRRYPVLGLVTAAVGVGVALLGGGLSLAASRAGDGRGSTTLHAALILGGTVLTQLGLIVATPAIVGATARLSRFLPLTPRLALRDAARNRGRSAPAVAAILGAVAGAVTLTLYVASVNDHDQRSYVPSLGYGQAFVSTTSYPGEPPRDPQQEIAAISAIAPPDRTIPVHTFANPSCEQDCPSVSVATPPENRCPADQPTEAQLQTDPRCSQAGYRGGRIEGPVVGSYDDLVALTGLRSRRARDVLGRGGIVVFDPLQVRDGTAALQLDTFDPRASGTAFDSPDRTVTVPATYVETREPFLAAVVSPAAAQKLGVPATAIGTILDFGTPPDDNTQEAVRAALDQLGTSTDFTVERGYRNSYGLGLLALLVASAVVTLGAAGVATGLAQADAKPDLATLAAIGAAPRMRRTLTAFQAAVVAGLGAVLGTASGFVPMVAYLWSDPSMRVVIPWLNLAVIALVVPAVAAVLAGPLTRSRLPMASRLLS